MPRIVRLELMSADLPLRRRFRHAAAERVRSESLFLKCSTDNGVVGFGESLPREYVTGETRDGAFDMLREFMLPRLAGMEFGRMEEVHRFLSQCDGRSPPDWVPANQPQSAAWCAVDLALLDTFGRASHRPVRLSDAKLDCSARRFSGVVSAEMGWKFWMTLFKLRAYGMREVKLKVGRRGAGRCARAARRILGRQSRLRVDANMAWPVKDALDHVRDLASLGIESVEQPMASEDLENHARLVREGRLGIIADESFSDGPSLQRLLSLRACTGVNVRISKCGGLTSAARRSREALDAGLTVQIGCQVGESSLLSAAQLILISALPQAKHLEGCYGKHLLREDPAYPCLQFGYGGRPPVVPAGAGLGVEMNEQLLQPWVNRRATVTARPST